MFPALSVTILMLAAGVGPVEKSPAEPKPLTGVILLVREVFPLSLTVKVGAEEYKVDLLEDTAVFENDKPVDASKLRPKLKVKIEPKSLDAAKRTATAKRIDILGDK